MKMFYNGFNLMIDLVVGGLAYFIGLRTGARNILFNLIDKLQVMELDKEEAAQLYAEWQYENQREQAHEENKI